MRDFTKLIFWERSHQLTLKIYALTRSFPKEEIFGLTSQMKRSSSSIPTNLSEGCGRNSNPQLKYFFNISAAKFKYAIADIPELTEAVIGWYKRRYGVDLEADEITSVNGSQEGLAHIGLTLFNPDDICLVPAPCYPIFEIGPFLSGAHIEYYHLKEENNYELDLDSIPEDIRPDRDQPFYHLLAESDDNSYVAYVSQQNLISDSGAGPVDHPEVRDFFERFENGRYQMRRKLDHPLPLTQGLAHQREIAVFEVTHEEIIDKETFETVQKMRGTKRAYTLIR